MDKSIEDELWKLTRISKDVHPRTLNIGFVGDKRGLTPTTGLTLAQWIISHQYMLDVVHVMSDEGGNHSFFDMVDLHAHHAKVYAYPPKKVAMHYRKATVMAPANPMRQHDAIADECDVLLVATDRQWSEDSSDLCWRAARRAEKQGKVVICFYPQGIIGPEPWKFDIPEQPAELMARMARESREGDKEE